MSSALEVFRRDFDGDVIEPGHQEYDAVSRSVFAAGSPALVVRPTRAEDVQAAVRYAAGAGLALSVRGGGHAFQGFGTNADGVVIDLGHLADLAVVDRQRPLVRIGGGATWGQVATALAPHGLAISSGDTRSVGVGGLTLSGGIGWKVRRYGLALDQLVGAEVVTADGELVRADAEQHPELFWAIRGGGGNFGIVTAFDFVAHRTSDVFHGKISFPASEAADVLRGWGDYLGSAPAELTAVVNLANPFLGGPEAPVEVVVVVDSDDPVRVAEVLEPIRRLGTVAADDVVRMPYPDVLVDGVDVPPGIEFSARSVFVEPESVTDVLRILAEVATAPGAPMVGVRSVGGAVARVPDDATAYAWRRAELMVVVMAAGPAPVVAAAAPGLQAVWDRLGPHVVGAYANFLSDATEEELSAIYPPETRRRLVSVKDRYDPGNLFSGNHNIRPRGSDRSRLTA